MNVNKNTPDIRFSGFGGNWIERKIEGVLTEEKRHITLIDDESYELVTVRRRNQGVISRGFLNGRDILVKNYFKVRAGDFLISKRQVIHGANGIVPSCLDKAIVSNEYLVIGDNEEIKTEFWALIARMPQMYEKFFLSSYGVDIEKMVFDVFDWKTRDVVIPGIAEQTAISDFFKNIDQNISLSRRKYEKTETLKNVLLSKMLPQAGKNQPEIRLKGFSGDWIEVKLEDTLLEQIKGKAQFDKLSNGVVEYLDAARLNRGKPFLCNAKNDVLQSDILIIWDGSNAGKVYRGFEGALGSTLKAYRTNEKYSSEFIFQHLLKNEKVIFAEFRTPNIPHVVKDFTSSYTVTAPNIEEQTAIGNFFKQLDDTLALQAKQLKALENLKKALLAKMFV